MKINKSTLYKLEVERTCTCKIAGEYEDPALKQARGKPVFTPCTAHVGEMSAVIEEVMSEFLEKEAKDAKAPEPPMLRHPRPAPHAAQTAVPLSEGEIEEPDEAVGADPYAGVPGRTVRTSGSAGLAGGAGGHRPLTALPKASSAAGHRPGGKPQGASPFKRSDPNANLSQKAVSHLRPGQPAAKPASLDMDMGKEVAEDHRISTVLDELNFLGDLDEGADG